MFMCLTSTSTVLLVYWTDTDRPGVGDGSILYKHVPWNFFFVMTWNKPNCFRVKQASTIASFSQSHSAFHYSAQNHRTGLLNAEPVPRGTDFTTKNGTNATKKMHIAR